MALEILKITESGLKYYVLEMSAPVNGKEPIDFGLVCRARLPQPLRSVAPRDGLEPPT